MFRFNKSLDPRNVRRKTLPLSVYLPLSLVAVLVCIAGVENFVRWINSSKAKDELLVKDVGTRTPGSEALSTPPSVTVTERTAPVPPAGSANPIAPPNGDPTGAAEQLFIYQLNRLRSQPEKLKHEYGIDCDLSDVQPRPPLAVSALLARSATFKAREMASHNYVEHRSSVTHKWPNKLAREVGFHLPDYFSDDVNNIEALGAGYADSRAALQGLIVDEGVPSLGHRKHLLGMDAFNQQATQVGVGFSQNPDSRYHHYWAIHATWDENSRPFLTGVVYADDNDNDVYDHLEGAARAVLMVDSETRISCNDAGGWSLEVKPGHHVVELVSPRPSESNKVAIEVNDQNVAIDFQTRGTVQIGFASLK